MNKKFLAAATLATATAAIVIPVQASADEPLDKNYLNINKESSIKFDKWKEGPLKLDGKIVQGFGITPYWSYHEYSYGNFYIKDLNYTTFEALIGLDDGNRTGDRGTSTINIYADDTLIYSKNFTNKTDTEKVQIQIPKGTENLTFIASYDPGKQGRHAIIVAEPTLTNALPSVEKLDEKSLITIGNTSSSEYTFHNYWRTKSWGFWDRELYSFKLGEKLVNRGLGLNYSNDEYAFAKYKISDYNYTTLEATIGVDANFSEGDRGKTTLEIFANGLPIYSKVITNKTKPENIAVAIPKNTENLSFFTSHNKGSQGSHRVVLDDPRLTNKLNQSPELKGQQLADLNVVSSNSSGAYANRWSSNNIFTKANGDPVTGSIGMKPHNSSGTEAYATYYIEDYNYNLFDTTFTLDSNYMVGDKGSAQVTVYADNKSIGSVKLNSKNSTVNFTKAIPKGTKYLKIYSKFTKGNAGTQAVVTVNPTLRDGFTDISSTHSYYEAINYLTSKNIINGYPDGTFQPSKQLTRAHAAVLVARALKLSDATSMKYSDMKKKDSSYAQIAAVVNAGLFDNIVKNNKFEPNKLLTRGEMADIITKAFKLQKSSSKTFVDTTSYWAKDSITAVYDNGITTGYEDGSFKPNATLTRGHFTIFMTRAMQINEKNK